MTGEFLDGELVVSPRPAPSHAFAGSGLGADLYGAFNRKPGGPHGPGGWWIVDEPELHIGCHIVVSDLAGGSANRICEPDLRTV